MYAPHVKHYPLQLQHFIFLILLKLQIISISSLSSSSIVQHTTNNLSTHVYKHFEFIFVAFLPLVNTYFDRKIIATDSSKFHNPVKCTFYTKFANVLAIVAYYAGIMLNAFAFLLIS